MLALHGSQDVDRCLLGVVDPELRFLVPWLSLIPKIGRLVLSFSTPAAKESCDYNAS